MSKVALLVGFGPGISNSMALKFGKEGYKLALISRTQSKLDAAASDLKSKGIEAVGVAADAGSVASLRKALETVVSKLGTITVLYWGAIALVGKPILEYTEEELTDGMVALVSGLLAAAKFCLPYMEKQPGQGEILITGGGLALDDEAVLDMAINYKLEGGAIGKAAQHKITRILNKTLKEKGVFVGEVMVNSVVKGTPFDPTGQGIDPTIIADKFWELYTKKSAAVAAVP